MAESVEDMNRMDNRITKPNRLFLTRGVMRCIKHHHKGKRLWKFSVQFKGTRRETTSCDLRWICFLSFLLCFSFFFLSSSPSHSLFICGDKGGCCHFAALSCEYSSAMFSLTTHRPAGTVGVLVTVAIVSLPPNSLHHTAGGPNGLVQPHRRWGTLVAVSNSAAVTEVLRSRTLIPAPSTQHVHSSCNISPLCLFDSIGCLLMMKRAFSLSPVSRESLFICHWYYVARFHLCH